MKCGEEEIWRWEREGEKRERGREEREGERRSFGSGIHPCKNLSLAPAGCCRCHHHDAMVCHRCLTSECLGQSYAHYRNDETSHVCPCSTMVTIETLFERKKNEDRENEDGEREKKKLRENKDEEREWRERERENGCFREVSGRVTTHHSLMKRERGNE